MSSDVEHPPLAPPSREGDSGFVSREADFFEDRFDYAVRVLQDVVVPEADHTLAVGFDDLGSPFVRQAVAVLPAVAFDGEAQGTAGKVDDEVADLVLARELDTELFRPRARPQAAFGIGHVSAQVAGEAGQSLFRHRGIPIPNPFPQGKGLLVRDPCISTKSPSPWGGVRGGGSASAMSHTQSTLAHPSPDPFPQGKGSWSC